MSLSKKFTCNGTLWQVFYLPEAKIKMTKSHAYVSFKLIFNTDGMQLCYYCCCQYEIQALFSQKLTTTTDKATI
jgi:hypothetical protein